MAYSGKAQLRDTTFLSPVVIHEQRLPDLAGYTLDSTAAMQAMGNTLDQNIALIAPFYIKNYGSGNISTASYRGGNASQIALVWNGVTLQNANSGNVDFSLIPSAVADEVSFTQPEQNSSFGQVNLSTKPVFQKKLRLQLANHYALHDILSQQILLSKANHKHAIRINVSQRKGSNSYPYPKGQRTEKQIHSNLYQKNANLDYSHAFNSKVNLSMAYWGQSYNRMVPPALDMASYAHQKDFFHRGMLKLAYKHRGTVVDFQQALLAEHLQYQDPSKKLNSSIGSVNWIQSSKIEQTFHQNSEAQLLVNNSRQSSQSDNYTSSIVRNIFWIRPSFTHTLKAAHSKIGLFGKTEWVNNLLNPLQYGAYLQQRIFKQVKVRLQAQRYLRNPTFNDLYWKEWGNPSLKPEYGAVYDLDISHTQIFKNVSHRTEVNFYSKNIKDWIIWLPVNASIWHALNARQVWARGFEIKENMDFSMGTVQCQISGYYSFVKSTYERHNIYSTEDILHKQLIYVPPHQASLTATLSYKSILLRYSQHYTSWRFTSSDNGEFLDSYQFSALYLNFRILNIHKNVLVADCQVDNLFNKRIETVANMPMPLRTFKFGIIYQLNQ